MKLENISFGHPYLDLRAQSGNSLSTLFSHVDRFKVAEVNLMLDWEDSSGSSSEDETEDWSMPKVLSAMRSSSHNGGRQSMKGLQMAISEGWLVQRARDMCSFAHDRYRQAVEAHAATLPSQVLGKMSFRASALLFLSVPLLQLG